MECLDQCPRCKASWDYLKNINQIDLKSEFRIIYCECGIQYNTEIDCLAISVNENTIFRWFRGGIYQKFCAIYSTSGHKMIPWIPMDSSINRIQSIILFS